VRGEPGGPLRRRCAGLGFRRPMAERPAARAPVPGAHHPALDGLRGVAVLMVLGFHFLHIDGEGGAGERALLSASRAGWAGVDLFFVLSGFLITGILIDARGTQAYFRAFYARRVLRIFPLYYAYLAVLFLAVPLLLPSLDVKPETQGWLWTYLGNVLFAREGGFQASPYTAHFWSLAVEEQFYLAWPLLVWVLPRRRLALACLGLVVGAFALRLGIHRTTFNATAAYVLTPARMDALALGALVAIAAREPAWWPRVRRGAPWLLAGSAAAVAAVWVHQGGLFGGDPVVQVWAFGPLAAGFAALLVLAVDGDQTSRLSGTLRNRSLRGAGKYSYGLYVLHYPIFLALEAAGFTSLALAGVIGSRLGGVLAFAAVAGLATFAAALLSWNLLEKRFLRWKDHVPYRGAVAASGSAFEAVAMPGSKQ
jgi:peptidoglycan/LPS O-acetylase OafA/YrhL